MAVANPGLRNAHPCLRVVVVSKFMVALFECRLRHHVCLCVFMLASGIGPEVLRCNGLFCLWLVLLLLLLTRHWAHGLIL